MIVNFNGNDSNTFNNFKAYQVLSSHKPLVNDVVDTVLRNHIDTALSVLLETQEGEITRSDIAATLSDSKENKELIKEDLDVLLSDFCEAVKARLHNLQYKVNVTSIQYNSEGDIEDVNVDVTTK